MLTGWMLAFVVSAVLTLGAVLPVALIEDDALAQVVTGASIVVAGMVYAVVLYFAMWRPLQQLKAESRAGQVVAQRVGIKEITRLRAAFGVIVPRTDALRLHLFVTGKSGATQATGTAAAVAAAVLAADANATGDGNPLPPTAAAALSPLGDVHGATTTNDTSRRRHRRDLDASADGAAEASPRPRLPSPLLPKVAAFADTTSSARNADGTTAVPSAADRSGTARLDLTNEHRHAFSSSGGDSGDDADHADGYGPGAGGDQRRADAPFGGPSSGGGSMETTTEDDAAEAQRNRVDDLHAMRLAAAVADAEEMNRIAATPQNAIDIATPMAFTPGEDPALRTPPPPELRGAADLIAPVQPQQRQRQAAVPPATKATGSSPRASQTQAARERERVLRHLQQGQGARDDDDDGGNSPPQPPAAATNNGRRRGTLRPEESLSGVTAAQREGNTSRQQQQQQREAAAAAAASYSFGRNDSDIIGADGRQFFSCAPTPAEGPRGGR